jgi:hypothetical protein
LDYQGIPDDGIGSSNLSKDIREDREKLVDLSFSRNIGPQ